MGLPSLIEQMEPRLLLDGAPSLPAPPPAGQAPAPAVCEDLLLAPPGEPLDALASATPAALTAATQGDPAGPGADADLIIMWDDYEPDNTYSDANVIVLESPIDQFHNFHSPTDEDWVKCYALADVWYEFGTADVGPNCDPVIDLYAFDGTTLLAHVDDWGIGQGESLVVQCPADGVYYARLTYRWFGPGIFPEYGTDYSLSAKRWGPSVVLDPGFIHGTITDAATGDEIADAIVVAQRSGSGMSQPNGVYAIGLAEGTYTVTAWAEGYQPQAHYNVVVPAGGTVERNFALARLGGAAAQVAGVGVGSTSWEAAFVGELGGDFGYAVPEGAAQLDELSWVNVDRVSIAFTEDVQVLQDDLSVCGVDVPQYAFGPSAAWTCPSTPSAASATTHRASRPRGRSPLHSPPPTSCCWPWATA